MNRIKIYGGLGNQMFQYGLYLAMKEKGIPVRLMFLNFFYERYHNGFNLSRCIKLSLPFPENVLANILSGDFTFQNKVTKAILRKIIKPLFLDKLQIYKESKEFCFDEKVFDQNGKLLVGTWQSEKYFKNIRPLILKEFEFDVPHDSKNTAIIKKIKETASVSIHIRRGDYVSDRWSKTHAMSGAENYYVRAIEFITSRFDNLNFFVFSDDIEWVKKNIDIPEATYITNNKGSKAYIDMFLMTLCNHNIIANSTFSWWGAWLNKNPSKVVIAPKTWLNSQNCDEIYNEQWIRI